MTILSEIGSNKEINTAYISDHFLCDTNPAIPLNVAMRLELNRQGIKFSGDNRPSVIANKDPIPLGVLIKNYDYDRRGTNYRQIIKY